MHGFARRQVGARGAHGARRSLSPGGRSGADGGQRVSRPRDRAFHCRLSPLARKTRTARRLLRAASGGSERRSLNHRSRSWNTRRRGGNKKIRRSERGERAGRNGKNRAPNRSLFLIFPAFLFFL